MELHRITTLNMTEKKPWICVTLKCEWCKGLVPVYPSLWTKHKQTKWSYITCSWGEGKGSIKWTVQPFQRQNRPEMELTFSVFVNNLLFFHMRNIWQQGSAQLTLLHLFVLFGLGSCLFLRKGQRRKIQDLRRYNVHRFYTPLALSSQRAEVPKHLLKGKGMLQPCT